MIKELFDSINENVTLNITIKKRDGLCIVMLVPKTAVDDPAYKKMPPIIAKGSPEDAEKDLLEAIANPLKEYATGVQGAAAFIEKTKKAEEEKDKKEKADKAAAAKAEKKSSGKGKKPEKADKAADEEPEEKTCRECGCTEEDCKQCIEKTGKPCTWVEDDLCSACAIKEDPNVQQIEKFLIDGNQAIKDKRAISAKSTRAKIKNIMEQNPSLYNEEIGQKVKDFVDAVNNLTGENELFTPKTETDASGNS
jgi:hypothetical protein